MFIETIPYEADKVKNTWTYLETIMPASYNELNDIVMKLVDNNNLLGTIYAKKVSPALSGTPTAPTAAKTVNNTQIATTAFVHLLAGAANNGGIVDSLLAQNGYVKFANGLIIQWGIIPGGVTTHDVIFPASCTPFAVVSNDASYKYDAANTEIKLVTNMGFHCDRSSSGTSIFWILIGIS